MPSGPLLMLVAYDVADDRRREAVAALLAMWGARVQFSVFECDLPDGQALDKLITDVRAAIEDDEDQVRFYRLHGGGGRDTPATVVGNRRLEERVDFHII